MQNMYFYVIISLKQILGGMAMEIGINLYSNFFYGEIIEAFVENNIRNTFVMADHPQLCEVCYVYVS